MLDPTAAAEGMAGHAQQTHRAPRLKTSLR
jgi:hypothetical protein